MKKNNRNGAIPRIKEKAGGNYAIQKRGNNSNNHQRLRYYWQGFWNMDRKIDGDGEQLGPHAESLLLGNN